MSKSTGKAAKINAAAMNGAKDLSADMREGMRQYILTWAQALKERRVTVAVLKASISKARAADLPIKGGHAQAFPVAAILLSDEAAARTGKASISRVLGLASNLYRVHGAKAAQELAAEWIRKGQTDDYYGFDRDTQERTSLTFAGFAHAVRSAVADKNSEDRGETGRGSAPAAASVDSVVTDALAALDAMTDVSVSDVAAAVTLVKRLQAIVKNASRLAAA